jgi:hypothetical protein
MQEKERNGKLETKESHFILRKRQVFGSKLIIE